MDLGYEKSLDEGLAVLGRLIDRDYSYLSAAVRCDLRKAFLFGAAVSNNVLLDIINGDDTEADRSAKINAHVDSLERLAATSALEQSALMPMTKN